MNKTIQVFKTAAGKVSKPALMIFLLLLHGYLSMAQNGNAEKEGDDIKAVRVAYMTDQLKLTPDEAQRFWPVYNNYRQEVKKARHDNAGDVVKQQEAVVSIRKKYKESFKNVMGSDERTNRVFTSEMGFNNMLRNEWQKRNANTPNNRRLQQPAAPKK